MDDKLNKLQKIDMILNNEDEFEKYINEIENTQISYSTKLEEKILSKVNNKESMSYFNVFKMVACMVLALILAQSSFIKNPTTNTNNNIPVTTGVVQGNTFINDKVNEISNFFMKPINIEKGEK